MAAFVVWGTDLFRPDVPFDPIAVQRAFYVSEWGWGPLDAPAEIPAGSTKRNDGDDKRLPFGVTRWVGRP